MIPGLLKDVIPTAVVIQRPTKWEYHYEKNIILRGRFAHRNKALYRQYKAVYGQHIGNMQ
jgi:uncharacterized protein (DUF924 family)